MTSLVENGNGSTETASKDTVIKWPEPPRSQVKQRQVRIVRPSEPERLVIYFGDSDCPFSPSKPNHPFRLGGIAEAIAEGVAKAFAPSTKLKVLETVKIASWQVVLPAISPVSLRWDALRGVLHWRVGSVLEEVGLTTNATLAEVINRLSERPTPSENEFNRLATEEPRQLVRWIEDGTLLPSQLTYAAEALGECRDSSMAVTCLFKLLTHPSSLVREGAVYGLEGHLDHAGVRGRLEEVVREDPRRGVRTAAAEALE